MIRGGTTTIRRQWASTAMLALAVLFFSVVSTGGQLPSLLFGGTRRLAAAPPVQRDKGDDHLHTLHPAAAATPAWTIRRTWLSSSSSSPPSSSNGVCKQEDVDVKTQLEEAERQLQSFLKSSRGVHRQKEEEQYEFYIHGWRWHTMSLIREASRLSKTSQKLMALAATDNNASVVVNKEDDWIADFIKAADYVVNFNMRGLHKIEKTLFFPWTRQRIISQLTALSDAAAIASHHQQQQQQHSLQQHQDVATAFGIIMNHLESERATVEQLGVQVVRMYMFFSILVSCSVVFTNF